MVSAKSRRSSTYQNYLINRYNLSIFKNSALLLTGMLFVLLVLSSIPYFNTIFAAGTRKIRRIYLTAFIVFSLFCLIVLLLKKTVRRYPLVFAYLFFALLYAFSVFINLSGTTRIPYTMTVCLSLIVPILIADSALRVNIYNLSMMAVCIAVSSRYKSPEFFADDIVNGGIFAVSGTIIGNFIRGSRLRYLDMKAQYLNKEIETEKAKSGAKTLFLTEMSHEIRTPVNSILGFNEVIMRESSEPNIQEYSHAIKDAGRTLLSLINNVLDLSKIEAGKIEIIPVEYKLSSTVNDVINMVSQRAKDKGLAFNVNIDRTCPDMLKGDELRFKQCIVNLLTNAIKYTEIGSVTMTIGWTKTAENRIALSVHIADTGIGIKEEDLPKLFKTFERISEKRTYGIEGSGLGLNIVKLLLEKMGSEIHVDSVYNKGSDFSFVLEQEAVSWNQIGDFTAQYISSINSGAVYKESFHAPLAHILVVDDTRMNLTVFCALLKRTQMQIDTALSGPEALQLAQQNRYNVIFVDYRMPGMDGIETLHAIKNIEGYAENVPCIALTANAVAGARNMYLNEGFTDYLSKPINSAQLEKMLIHYLPPEVMMQEAKTTVPAAAAVPAAELPDIRFAEGIDIPAAISACGGEDILKELLQQYRSEISGKSNLIQTYMEKKDYPNFTVQVHSLKNTSRLIGALELSSQAAYLEQCGDRKDEDEIMKKTPELLELYRSYTHKLAAFSGEKE